MSLTRRTTLLSALGGLAGGLAAPHVANAQAARTLRFVPQADLSGLDPVMSTLQVVRNASLLMWDTLYGIDSRFEPRPQMVEGHEMAVDGLTWTFRLREGLRFHDGTPVLARDAVASIRRWMPRDVMGARLLRVLDEMVVTDDRTFRLRLKQPFPKLLLAFGKSTTLLLCVMPERIASTDSFKAIGEYVGSGPMVFRRDEWVAGARAVFQRFDGYAARAEPNDWLSGGKRISFDRIEWTTMPDASTAAAALQAGEIDWWESAVTDLVPLLKRNRSVQVDIADPLGNVALLKINHLHPPFNDPRARQALQLIVNQSDYMQAVTGNDEVWKPMPSFFTPGTPFYTEAGGERLKGPRRFDEAKRLLAEAGYKGEPIVLPVATDVPTVKNQGEVTVDILKQAGINVDLLSMDWGSQSARAANKALPAAGGWNLSHTWVAGAECVTPAGHKALDASGVSALSGWAKSDAVQSAIDEWFTLTDAAASKASMDRIDRVSMEFVTVIPTGFFQSYTARRKTVEGVAKSPYPQFWGVSKRPGRRALHGPTPAHLKAVAVTEFCTAAPHRRWAMSCCRSVVDHGLTAAEHNVRLPHLPSPKRNGSFRPVCPLTECPLSRYRHTKPDRRFSTKVGYEAARHRGTACLRLPTPQLTSSSHEHGVPAIGSLPLLHSPRFHSMSQQPCGQGRSA